MTAGYWPHHPRSMTLLQSYLLDSFHFISWFDSPSVSALDHSHGNSNEEKHLPLLHAARENQTLQVMGLASQPGTFTVQSIVSAQLLSSI